MATQANRVLAALSTGEELTAKQMRSRFGFSTTNSVRATIAKLRRDGNAIYLNERSNSKGTVTQKYRLGAPSRSMVAAAAAAGYFG